MVAETDGVAQATAVIDAATQRGVPLRLLGGLAVRVLTPEFPPRSREGQDLDFASLDTAKKPLMELFAGLGYQGDARFNTLHGDHQMYFRTPDGSRAVDVIMNELTMCHTLQFRDRLTRMPYTLDVTDLLLSKLQVLEQNEKDVQDIIYLLSAFGAGPDDRPGMIGLDRITGVIGSDWGWWRTVTGNLDKVAELADGPLSGLVPPQARYDPAVQARALRTHADTCPKTMRWKMRARVGERVRWYELPEEVAH